MWINYIIGFGIVVILNDDIVNSKYFLVIYSFISLKNILIIYIIYS